MKKIINLFIIFLFCIGTILLSIKLENISAAAQYPFTGLISADSLVVHSKANTEADTEVTELAYGTKVNVTGSSNGMYKITYDTNKVGYVSDNYVVNYDAGILTTDVKGIETYDNYCNSLVSKGFDRSYCQYLYYLHYKYPNWEFKADVVNYTLEEAAKAEEDKVVLQTKNENYWLNGKHIEGDYYYIKDSVITSFMDPRNGLFDSLIFQFVDLESSKNIFNDATLKSISGSGNLSKYLESFKKAATTVSINPVHIMTRSSQEGANKSNYAAVTGKYTSSTGRTSVQGYSLDGYYNFYNIGSYADKNYDYTVQRGLAYAAGFLEDNSCMVKNSSGKYEYSASKCGQLSYNRPWNTPEKAIIGGAMFIANDYISKGQDTLYFQKFNIATYSSLTDFTHQYMTNIYAPMSEGSKMYEAYKDGKLLNSKFTFIIPVYKNMSPDISEPVDKSSNSRLSSITIDDKALSEFDPVRVEYLDYKFITGANTIRVGAKTEDSKATVTGTGTYTFDSNGVANVKLTVTAENGNKTIYTVVVERVKPAENITVNDIVSKMGVKVDGSIMYGISPGTDVSTLVKTVTNNKGKATVVDSSNKSKTSGKLASGDKITISGTTDNKQYTIAVRGDVNGDGVIKINDLILVQSHILNKGKLTGYKLYAGDTNYDGSVKINDLILIQSQILGKINL